MQLEQDFVALVTGCSRRCGALLASQLKQAGADVIGHFRTMTDDVERLDAMGCTMIQADLTNHDQLLHMIDYIMKHYSHLSLLIHNASSFEVVDSDYQASLKQLQQFIDVHVSAPFAINEALSPLLLKCPQQHANLIHITDIYVDNPAPKYRSYCAAKAGLHSLYMSYAKLLAPKVRVNAIQPGPVQFLPSHTQQQQQDILGQTLLNVEGGYGPIYEAVKFLVLNPYVTGASIKVDGGRSLTEWKSV
jgi:dihydromonapterin reductase/dihydrofolate reductase